ncbi:uncharacterized protein LOC123317321 [Coccinella septempunctata]|uniref:uncharacterized protein LOC123317321 n=1 Tax=Coccinella septempunctata TaxID=41139 RepID=UPI001D0872AA|nr:uncharacterized protein LOC123317321 [Coccinella septempunctata]
MFGFLIGASLFVVVLFAVLPLLLFKFVVSQLLQSVWFWLISLIYPDLEFVKTTTVRSLLDTHRNQGIGSILLRVKGPAQPDAVKRHLQEVVNRRSKNGKLSFPRLHQALVTKGAQYAWKKVQFDIEKNVSVSTGIFKNRPVTEFNIQEYVSDLVSKYLPPNCSPWHIIIIPTLEDHHYILLKLHHILLNEHLNIGDLLPLIPPTKPSTGFFASDSPLNNIFKKPKSTPKLLEHIVLELTNFWNEFLSNYDPLENVALLKDNPSFTQFLAIAFITFVSIVKEIRRGFRVIKPDLHSRFTFVSYTIEKEKNKRQLHLSVFLKSIVVSLDPRNLFRISLKLFWTCCISLPVLLPSMLISEFFALYQCVVYGYCNNINTFVGSIKTYVPLIYGALFEFIELAKIIFYSPKNIISHILCQKEYLQTVTLSGRKCVAWSEPIKSSYLKTISKNFAVSELEIMLTAFSKNLSKYLKQTDHVIPEEIAIFMRNINSNYVFATGVNVRPEDSCSGILFMGLPVLNEEKGDTMIENLVKIRNRLNESLEKQQMSYFLTILQTKFGILTEVLPSILLIIYLRYLSRKFAISVTEVSSRHPNVTQKTIWGQEVESAIYFRPPQANTCISVCFNEYADHVKLGVICDTRLIPNHVLLARNFVSHIEDLTRYTPSSH